MESERVVIPGLVRNGLVVPLAPVPLPEGAQVEIVISSPSPELTAELRAEFETWERASDEAWALIDQWECEDRS